MSVSLQLTWSNRLAQTFPKTPEPSDEYESLPTTPLAPTHNPCFLKRSERVYQLQQDRAVATWKRKEAFFQPWRTMSLSLLLCTIIFMQLHLHTYAYILLYLYTHTYIYTHTHIYLHTKVYSKNLSICSIIYMVLSFFWFIFLHSLNYFIGIDS